MIPKIIHHIWFQGEKNIPSEYPDYRKSWKIFNPTYQYEFWDECRINNLITNDYPEYLEKYLKFNMIQKIDMAKYCIIYKYYLFLDI